mgnify:FL=1
MDNKPSTQSAHSINDSDLLSDLGSLWSHPTHGLVLLTGVKRKCSTSFGETLYTVYVYRLADQFNTEGFFTVHDWLRQFTRVA